MVLAAAFYDPDIAVAFMADDPAGFTAGQRRAREAVWLPNGFLLMPGSGGRTNNCRGRQLGS
jgi:hypothetical protein